MQEQLAALLVQRRSDSEEADSLREDIHNLSQQASRIQPSAMRWARKSLLDNLGDDIFAYLDPDAQEFLVTAQTYYDASEQIAHQADTSLIVVEYAKSLEVEIQRHLLLPLAELLESSSYRGELPVAPQPMNYQGPGSWTARLPQLMLGKGVAMLKKALNETKDERVKRILCDAAPSSEWLHELIEDLEQVANRYRNGAAHTQHFDRQLLDEFRNLLVERGLLRRLVQLERKLREQPTMPQSRIDRSFRR